MSSKDYMELSSYGLGCDDEFWQTSHHIYKLEQLISGQGMD
jgi:hypothetical protein